MRARRISLAVLVFGAALICGSLTLNADPPAGGAGPKAKDGPAADDKRVSVAAAKDRARVMHEIYSSTLDVVHHHYFRGDRPVLPARAMEDVFAEVDKQTGTKTRWIAVNTPAMSINHEPETEFEKKAAAAIADGRDEYVAVEKGYYTRATPIPLKAGCVGCHTKLFGTTAKTPRFAGLVVSIPVKDE